MPRKIFIDKTKKGITSFLTELKQDATYRSKNDPCLTVDHSYFEKMLDLKLPVFVLNNTEIAGVRGKLSIPIGNGELIEIEKTFAPLEIYPAHHRKALRESKDLHACLRKKLIIICEPISAIKAIENNPKVEEELHRINKDLTVTNKSINDVRDTQKLHANRAEDVQVIDQDSGEGESDANPAVVELLVRLQDGTLKTREVVSSLKNMEYDLKNADYQYILSNSKESSIKNFAAERLSTKSKKASQVEIED